MKKVAFISDIHSNLPALEATLSDIESKGIDEIYCLGDIIGYHSFTNDVIKMLKDRGVISIMGNHDKVIADKDFDRELDKNFVMTWNCNELTDENREYLKSLPETLILHFERVSVQIVHGSPNSIEEYIREGSEEADYFIENMDTDVLISGHTHIPYITEKDGKYLLNTGSVGKPKIGKPQASYLVLGFNIGEVEPEMVFIDYSVEIITDHLRKRSFPNKYVEALETGNP